MIPQNDPEAVEAGTVRLVGTDKDAVHAAAHELLSNVEAYKLMSNSVNPYGDGKHLNALFKRCAMSS